MTTVRIAPALLAALLLSIVVLATNVAASCCVGDCGEATTDKPKTFEKDGASFEYPGDWKKGNLDSYEAADNELWHQAFAKKDGSIDIIVVAASQLTREIDFEADYEALAAEARGGLEDQGAQIDGDAVVVQAGALDAILFTGIVEGEDDEELGHRWYYAIDGDISYFINCQWTEKSVDDVNAACDLLVDSFRVD
ncbi:hypothetical protein AYO38_04975 [bacterium SCGC AG-212-C10]|nr:hypothetical protein AYO38_04975 [bacterium SCGC AG-212-C10]